MVRFREIAGLVLVAVGFLVVFERTLATTLSLNQAFVAGIGVIAVLLGLNYFKQGRMVTRRDATVEDVERRYEATVPGDDTDSELSRIAGFSRTSIRNRREFHSSVRDVAVETLAARGDYPGVEAAQTALENGTWTDDPAAAWFLSDEKNPPLRLRLRGLVGQETQFTHAARRAIAELYAARGLDARLPEADDADSTDTDSDPTDTDSDSTDGDTELVRVGETTGSANGVADTPAGPTPGTTPDGSERDGDSTPGATAGESTSTDGATGSDARELWRMTETDE